MAAREEILSRIRAASSSARSGRTERQGGSAGVTAWGDSRAVDRFIELARDQAATVVELESVHAVPAAVGKYLAEQDLPQEVVCGADIQAHGLPWDSAAPLRIIAGPLSDDGRSMVTGCYAAIAELGALVVVSGPDHPAETNVLPANHIVLLPRERVLGDFDGLWRVLREDFLDSTLPRAVTLIAGPSRTADLGVPAKLGAHGPGRVHVLLIGRA